MVPEMPVVEGVGCTMVAALKFVVLRAKLFLPPGAAATVTTREGDVRVLAGDFAGVRFLVGVSFLVGVFAGVLLGLFFGDEAALFATILISLMARAVRVAREVAFLGLAAVGAADFFTPNLLLVPILF